MAANVRSSPLRQVLRRTLRRALLSLPILALAGLPMPAAADPGIIADLSGGRTAPTDGPIARTFYESFRVKACPNEVACLINFKKVPANRILRVTNINCWINIETEADSTIVQLIQGPKAEIVAKAAFAVPSVASDSSIGVFMMNVTTSAFIAAGKPPIIVLNAGSPVPTLAGQCAISGELLAP